MPRLRRCRRDRPLTQPARSELVEELIALGVSSGIARSLVALGVSSVADLATRSPTDLFVQSLDRTSRTHRNVYDAFVRAVLLAGGRVDEREPDPLLPFWRFRHGQDTPLPINTKLRFRAPTIGVSAGVVTTTVDPSGHVARPLGQHEVGLLRDPAPRVAIGHWMWRGGLGAFARLEDLRVGDGVEFKGVGGGWFVVTDVEMLAGNAPPPLPEAGGDELLLATPPHRRAWIIGLPEQLPPVQRDVLQVRVRTVATQREATETEPRRKRPIRGAF